MTGAEQDYLAQLHTTVLWLLHIVPADGPDARRADELYDKLGMAYAPLEYQRALREVDAFYAERRKEVAR